MANEYQQRYSASDTSTAGGFLFDDDDAGKDIGVSKIVFGADGAAITRVSGGNGTAATALRVTLASDSTGVLAATQSGTWNVTNISGTISLPTGAATSAKQDTEIASLASIDSKLPALGQAQAEASVPVVLTAAQLSTLTPPAAITGFATAANQSTLIGHVDGIETLLAGTLTVGTHAVTQSGTWTVQPGNTANTTAWLVTGTGGTFPVTGTFWQATQPVSLASTTITGTVAVTQSGTWDEVGINDSGNSITVDAPVATPVFVRLSDGSSAISTLPVSLTSTTITGTVAVTQSGTWDEVGINDSGNSITVDNGGTFAVQSTLQAGTAYAGKLRLTDGTTDAEVVPLTGYNAQAVAIVDGDGAQITSFGGGTQYTEDAAAAANPVGTAPILVRKDTPAATVTTDGDNIAQRGSDYGAAYVTLIDNAGAFVSVGGGTQYDEDTASADAQKLTMAGVTRADTAASQVGTNGDRTTLIVDSSGMLHVNVGTSVLPAGAATESTLSSIDTDTGNLASVVTSSGMTPATTGLMVYGASGSSARHVELDGNGHQYVINSGTFAVQVSSAIPAGTNNIGDVDVLSIVPGTGATNLGKAVDSVAGATDTGVAPLAIRDDTLTTLTPADGDYANLRVNSVGALHVVLPTTQAITEVAGVTSLIGGSVAHDSADVGTNPHKIGAKAETALSGVTLVADGDITNLYAGVDGVLITRPHCNLEDIITATPVAITDGSSTSVIAAAGSGIKIYLTSVTIANSSATFVTVDLRDGTAGSVKWTLPVPATGGVTHTFNPPLPFSANTAIAGDPSAAASTITISAIGFKSKV